MQKVIKISSETYKKINKKSLFFVRKSYGYDTLLNEIEWRPTDKEIDICFPAKEFGESSLHYCLCLIDGFSVKHEDAIGLYEMRFHVASATNNRDCEIILQHCVSRSCDKEDKYAFVELLWLFDKSDISFSALQTAVASYDSRTIPFVLDVLRAMSRCLSVAKQETIKSVFEQFGGEYKVYMPSLVYDAFQLCAKSNDSDVREYNIFDIVNEIVGETESKCPTREQVDSGNNIFQLLEWLHNNNALRDYNSLIPFFSLVSEPIRLEIVKRYFHDVRMGKTRLDIKLIEQFRSNKYDIFIRCRYAVETPSERVVLTVPFLCDSILTLLKSKGQCFQTFDGILDFAMTRCDKNHPGVDFKLERLIPVCKGGASYNKLFKGFVVYKLVCKIDQEQLIDETLLKYIREELDRIGVRAQYPACKYDDATPIETVLCEKCSRKIIEGNVDSKNKCKNYIYKAYSDKWVVKGTQENKEILNSFLTERIQGNETLFEDMLVDVGMVSLKNFRNYIQMLLYSFNEEKNDEFVIEPYKTVNRKYQARLIERFFKIVKIRVFPQKDVFVGPKFDVFGFRKDLMRSVSPAHYQDQQITIIETCKEKERKEIYNRVVESLKKEFNALECNGLYFELPYNKLVLDKIVSRYYVNTSYTHKSEDSYLTFLESNSNNGFYQYCAPELSEVNNSAINLPFFWCRGKECFKNNLGLQLLEKVRDWRLYSLYHLTEIIGYPKIHITPAGNEPDPMVRSFIAITNKVVQKFRRLKCRSCGHLLFVDRGGSYNRYNNYSCVNPICLEYQKRVYLNFCYKCKSGLIDSRDSAKCPNGWYICPSCLSCCDDAQYDRQSQLYILSKTDVPERIQRMLGRGHNDKGLFFCPRCGTGIEVIDDGGEKYSKPCPKCGSEFRIFARDFKLKLT